jgi:cardiolipin synthase A/B
MIIRNHPIRSHNHVSLLQSGDSYFSKLEQLIADAKYSIHLQVYIFDNDITGQRILQLLTDAVKRGVEVYLVVDAYASKDFTQAFINRLRATGIWVKKFAPLHLKQFKIGRRLHHKIVLVDERYALVGGINIADNYSGYNRLTPWFDVAVYTEGDIAYDLKKICISIWPKRIQKKWQKIPQQTYTSSGTGKLKVLQNDWWRRRIELSSAYNNAFRNAQHELIIVASYLLPGFTKRRLIKKALDRGVKVILITSHASDIPFMTAAIKYLYGVMLKNNITIYEWNKSVLHAKMALADGNWCTVGSYNLNALSDYGSLEANVAIMDEPFGKQAHDLLHSIIRDGCLQVDAEQFFKSNTYLKQAFRWASYKLMRVLLFVLFVLMNRDKLKH